MDEATEQLGAAIRAHTRSRQINAGFAPLAFAFELRALAAAVESGALVHAGGGFILEDFTAARAVNAAGAERRMLSVKSSLVFEVNQ